MTGRKVASVLSGRKVASLLIGGLSIVAVGYWASLSGSVQDPLREFLLAFILILVFNALPVVSTTITLYWALCGMSLQDQDKVAHEDSLVRAPLSAGIGFVEQVLYVYCLTSTHREFIGSILLFKAFFGWLSMEATRDTHHQRLLMRFYVYAIGNFMSLAFAILFFEVVHLSGPRFIPWLLSL